MLFNDINNVNINLKLCGDWLKCVSECKYLGLIIDKDLQFNKHADYIID